MSVKHYGQIEVIGVTGLPPFIVPTTNVVTNLNADKLDGTDVNDGGTTTSDLWTASKIQSQIDAAIDGREWLSPVRVKAQGDITLATDAENGDTIDGVVLATGDRIACFNQTTTTEDGIYVVQASGAAVRSTDFANGDGVANHAFTVEEGTDAEKTYVVSNNGGSDVVGTDDLILSQVGGGEANTGSNVGADGVGVFDGKVGVDLQFRNVAPGSSKITVTANGNDIDIDAVEANFTLDNIGGNLQTAKGGSRHKTAAIGDGVATDFAIAHNFGTRALQVTVYRTASPFDIVRPVIEFTDTNTVTIKFGTAVPTSNQFTYVIAETGVAA